MHVCQGDAILCLMVEEQLGRSFQGKRTFIQLLWGGAHSTYTVDVSHTVYRNLIVGGI